MVASFCSPAQVIPQITLPDLLLELDNWTGFLRHFTHLTSGDAPTGDEKLVLVAALMGMGMNLGLTKMEQSCPYTRAPNCPGQ
ncbi:MAG TPA: Tn3 family transposase [Ktedonobacteraceae bacterium]|nr:Tn3 family transposase [Ktedonobacteraceae bacterium]